MKSIRMLGLVLASALVLGVLVAAGTAQATPEFGQCVKVKKGAYTNAGCTTTGKKGKYNWIGGPSPTCEKKKKGEYTNSTCTEKSSKPKKGKYEKKCAKSCADISASGGSAYLESASGLRIECKTNGSEDGEILSPTQATGVAVYTGCEIESLKVKCESAGSKAGEHEIKTYPLESTPVEIGGKAWVQYTNEHGANAPYLAEFSCEVVSIRVKGSADGLDSGNVNTMSVTSTQEFSKTLGNQMLTSESNTGSGYGSPESSYQNQTTTFTTEDPTGGEIRL
jgi:hypothetical protein